MNLKKEIKVVFADDSDIHHFILRNLLPQFGGIRLLCQAQNGRELLVNLDATDEVPDVAILDLHMPVLDGNLTAQELLSRFPEIKIYGFTSSSDESEKVNMLSYGFAKVYAKNQLKELLMEVLG